MLCLSILPKIILIIHEAEWNEFCMEFAARAVFPHFVNYWEHFNEPANFPRLGIKAFWRAVPPPDRSANFRGRLRSFRVLFVAPSMQEGKTRPTACRVPFLIPTRAADGWPTFTARATSFPSCGQLLGRVVIIVATEVPAVSAWEAFCVRRRARTFITLSSPEARSQTAPVWRQDEKFRC